MYDKVDFVLQTSNRMSVTPKHPGSLLVVQIISFGYSLLQHDEANNDFGHQSANLLIKLAQIQFQTLGYVL